MARKLWLIVIVLLALTPALAREKFQQPGPVHLDREGERWAERTLKKLSLEQKIGQMFMIWARVEFLNLNSPEYARLREAMKRYHLGGFGVTVPVSGALLARSEPFEAAALLNQLQRESELPLIFAADFERGVATRLVGSTVFPASMAFGAAGKPEYAEAFGRITAQEARAVGVQWNFFPVADVNSNPSNPIINIRAFSEDPQQVGALVSAYIRGARNAGMLTTAKHFPGHGDTDTDSHLGLARVGGDRARLESIELPPFRKAIEAGVDAVMVAHVSVPALEPDPNHVASTSAAIINGVLKKELGFPGIVVTDALDMGALMRLYAGTANPSGAAAVAAVKAGNDMVIIPADLDGAYNGLLAAVRSGEIPQWQIDASVLKLLKAKASVGLHKAQQVDFMGLQRFVADPESLAQAQRVADEAVTLVRDNGQVLPLGKSNGTTAAANPYLRSEERRNRIVAVIFTDDVRAEPGRVLERQLRARAPEASVFWVDSRNAAALSPQIMAAVDQAKAVIAAVYMVPTAFKQVTINGVVQNTVAVVEDQAALLHGILERAEMRTAVVALGSPYVVSDFPGIQTYLCTFSNAPVSEVSAVRALFGEISIHGRLPVSIPNVAPRGAGLDRPQVFGGGQKPHAKNKTSAGQ